jgi:hypothetical protein
VALAYLGADAGGFDDADAQPVADLSEASEHVVASYPRLRHDCHNKVPLHAVRNDMTAALEGTDAVADGGRVKEW